MKNLTHFQRRRAKHLIHNKAMSNMAERSRLMQWALRKWGRSTVFGSEYAKYFNNLPGMPLGFSCEATRLHVKLGSYFQWETWAWALTFPREAE